MPRVDQLRASLITVGLCDELLTAKRGPMTHIYRLIITHHRESLISNSAQIGTLVKADIVLFCRLNELTLVHDLANLLLQHRVWLVAICLTQSSRISARTDR